MHDSQTALIGNKQLTKAGVSGYCEVIGNKRADKLTRAGSSRDFCCPEPVIGISNCLINTQN